jgi:hypothetical protein
MWSYKRRRMNTLIKHGRWQAYTHAFKQTANWTKLWMSHQSIFAFVGEAFTDSGFGRWKL